MRLFRGSIRNYILAVVLLCALPGALFILVNGLREAQESVARVEADLLSVTLNLAEIQARQTEAVEILLDGLARLPEIRHQDAVATKRLLSQVHELHPIYGTIHLVDRNGDLIASSTAEPPVNFGHTKHYQDAVADQKFSPGEQLIGVTLDVPVFTFGAPVFNDDDEVTGALLTSIRLERFEYLFRRTRLPQTSFFGLMDHGHVSVYGYSEGDAFFCLDSACSGLLETMAAGANSGILTTTSSYGERFTIAYEKLRLSPDEPPYMYIVTGMPTDAVHAIAFTGLRNNLLVLAGVVALTLLFGWYLGWRKLGRSLTELSEAAARVGQGELSTRVSVTTDIEELNALGTAFNTMIQRLAADLTARRGVEETLRQREQDLLNAYDAAIQGWGYAVDLKDVETENHSQRVTDLTVRLAERLGLTGEALLHIRRGALLHDIGKMGIPDSILFKPGPLTEKEWEIMRRHPSYAMSMLANIEYLQPALAIPYSHHEKWDGSGYPQGFVGKEIPLSARIFAVVDVYDALTNDRPYREAWTSARALEYIREEAGKHFDPEVVDVFLAEMQDLTHDHAVAEVS